MMVKQDSGSTKIETIGDEEILTEDTTMSNTVWNKDRKGSTYILFRLNRPAAQGYLASWQAKTKSRD